MANPYHDIVRTKVVAAMGAAKAVAGISHPGLKGKIREILIRDLFRPLLPADIGVGSGQIISYYNNDQSKEQDIVLYDRSILPPILFDEFMGLFPIESVLYTIEVKSTLTVAELQKSHESALMLDKFGYLPGQTDESGNPRHHTIEKIRSVLIALDTDLSIGGKSEIERYREVYGDQSAFLRALCVVGRGYWYHDGKDWINAPGKYPGAELIGLLGGVMNTYKGVARSRGYPSLGNYVIAEK